MLIIGDKNCIPSNIKNNFVIYNLLSTGTYPIVDIVPNAREFDYSEEGLDIRFLNFIFNDDYYFYEFFGKIIYPLYLGYHVYLITERNDIMDSITESLMKLIQQRYYYNAAFVNEPEDLQYINQDETFSIMGLVNLDSDKERYSLLYTAQNVYKTESGEVKIRGYE